MAQDGHETEIKLAVEGVEAAKRLLRSAGFRVWKRRVFEVNVIYDTEDQSLRNGSRLLRVREAGREKKLAFKGQPIVSKHKSREELEVEISDARAMSAILERLGYRASFRYEKYRTEYQQPHAKQHGSATVDETPIGVYMELEGTPEWIDRTAAKMGFGEQDYINKSYGRLYMEWCEGQGKTPSNMVFRDA